MADMSEELSIKSYIELFGLAQNGRAAMFSKKRFIFFSSPNCCSLARSSNPNTNLGRISLAPRLFRAAAESTAFRVTVADLQPLRRDAACCHLDNFATNTGKEANGVPATMSVRRTAKRFNYFS